MHVPRGLVTADAALTRRALLALGVGSAALLLAACSNRETQPNEQRPAKSWGVFVPVLTAEASQLKRAETLAGAHLGIVLLYAAIADPLPDRLLTEVRDAEATTLLTLEPWVPADGISQPTFNLASISEGRHDAALTRWARQLASWKHPVLLRFAQEMNGNWYPWSLGINGNTPAQYRAAWQRMHTIISGEAKNVSFVWAPNAITAGVGPFSECYPGDLYVDYLGLDGYNWGASPGHQWQSPAKLFEQSLSTLRQLSPDKPILITEVGCAEGTTPDLKAGWIRDFFGVIEAEPGVQGFVWFQMDKERDWRFNSSPASTVAFREGLASWLGGRAS